MRSFKAEGIVIKRINFGEADKIITVFTKDHGKLQVKASGIRRIGSRRSPHVELLNHSQLSLHKGYKWPVLTEAQTIESYEDLKKDLTKVGFAYHICELVDGLCPEEQENEKVFYLLRNVFSRMTTADDNLPEIIHEFEVELLTLLGYWNSSTPSEYLNTGAFIENLLERRLKSRRIFGKVS